MNEYRDLIEIVGNEEDQQLFRSQMFEYYSKDRINEILEKSLPDPVRRNGCPYQEDMIQRWRDLDGGYHFYNNDVWVPVCGPEANVDLCFINERRQSVYIESRVQTDLDLLTMISATYPRLTFYFLSNQQWLIREFSAVIIAGRIMKVINVESPVCVDDCQVTTINIYDYRKQNEIRTHLRMCYENRDEYGSWIRTKRRTVDFPEEYYEEHLIKDEAD